MSQTVIWHLLVDFVSCLPHQIIHSQLVLFTSLLFQNLELCLIKICSLGVQWMDFNVKSSLVCPARSHHQMPWIVTVLHLHFIRTHLALYFVLELCVKRVRVVWWLEPHLCTNSGPATTSLQNSTWHREKKLVLLGFVLLSQQKLNQTKFLVGKITHMI